MSCLRKQNADKTAAGHGINKFSIVLSQMQTRNFNQCHTIYNICYQRARRKDAEPITRDIIHGCRLFLLIIKY